MLRGARRGARAVRMELPETVAAAAGRRASGPSMGGAVGASVLARVPARTAVAQGDLDTAQSRASDRRDRQGGRRIRSVSARAAVGFAGNRSRTLSVPRGCAPRRGADLESRTRTIVA